MSSIRGYNNKNIISLEWFVIHEKNKRDLRFILTIKIEISYWMFFLTELSIAPKLQMDSIFPFKKKITVAKLTKTSSEEFSLVPKCWWPSINSGPFHYFQRVRGFQTNFGSTWYLHETLCFSSVKISFCDVICYYLEAV